MTELPRIPKPPENAIKSRYPKRESSALQSGVPEYQPMEIPRTATSTVTGEAVDVYDRYDRLIRLAVETLGSPDAAREWLDTPQDTFAGKTPLAFAKDTDFDLAPFELHFIRLAHGIYS